MNRMLTDAQVIDIRKRRSNGESCASIGSSYGRSAGSISTVATGVYYSDLPLVQKKGECKYKQDTAERFWSKVKKTLGCWEWVGAKDTHGYGAFSMDVGGVRKVLKAHRLSWEFINGTITNKLGVCHHCDNPGCVNPDHLFLGTQKDNGQDMAQKLRSSFGSKNGMSRFTDKEVLEIRKLRAAGKTYIEIGRKFNISRGYAYRLATGNIWKHLPNIQPKREER